MPGTTIAVADDGEVLVRSQAVAPERCTDGWLHTGRFE
jgi:long-subunit acyl-CoA synthetase (AMP-forming)